MPRSLFLPLLLAAVFLPSPLCGQHHNHHHSHLDTDPDMELRPARPMTTRKSTLRAWIHLPTVPSFPDHGELMSLDENYDDSYDYNTQWPGSGADGTESQSTVVTTEDEDEYVDPFEGHRDHFRNGSSAVIVAWFLFFLPLISTVLLS